MKTCRALLLGVVLSLAGAVALRAEGRPPAVTARDLYPLAKLAEAQQVATAQGKPLGFLLTWPIFFPGAKDFHANGSLSASYFYQAFKDCAVLVNVDHSTGELERLPKAAADAFHSPAEGGFAPCLCLTDPSGTRLIGMIPLWNTPIERGFLFTQYRAVIADQKRWGEPAKRMTVTDAAATPGLVAAAVAVAAPVPTPRPAATPHAPASSSFARELELTRQAEQQQQQSRATPTP